MKECVTHHYGCDCREETFKFLLAAAKGYVGNGHDVFDSDKHLENECRQCKLEKAIAQAEARL